VKTLEHGEGSMDLSQGIASWPTHQISSHVSQQLMAMFNPKPQQKPTAKHILTTETKT
jgi:hypothetical protein